MNTIIFAVMLGGIPLSAEVRAGENIPWRGYFSASRELLSQDVKFLIQYQDDEHRNLELLDGPPYGSTTFSSEAVKKFRLALQHIEDFRASLESDSSPQGKRLTDALDRWARELSQSSKKRLTVPARHQERVAARKSLVIDRSLMRKTATEVQSLVGSTNPALVSNLQTISALFLVKS